MTAPEITDDEVHEALKRKPTRRPKPLDVQNLIDQLVNAKDEQLQTPQGHLTKRSIIRKGPRDEETIIEEIVFIPAPKFAPTFPTGVAQIDDTPFLPVSFDEPRQITYSSQKTAKDRHIDTESFVEVNPDKSIRVVSKVVSKPEPCQPQTTIVSEAHVRLADHTHIQTHSTRSIPEDADRPRIEFDIISIQSPKQGDTPVRLSSRDHPVLEARPEHFVSSWLDRKSVV